MPTIKEMAQKYASRIRAAIPPHTEKVASASGVTEVVKEAVKGVLREIGKITYEGTDRSLTQEDLELLFSAIEAALAAEPGTFRVIKEASLQSALEFEQALAVLVQQIHYKSK